MTSKYKESGRQAIVEYEDAQAMIPYFKVAVESGTKGEKESAGRILSELRDVRNIDYTPLRGQPILLNDIDYDFLKTVANHLEIRV